MADIYLTVAEIYQMQHFLIDSSGGLHGVRDQNATPRNIQVVTDIVQQGKYAGKFTIHEDDVFNAQQLRQLEADGYRVDQAKDGEDGLFQAREYPVDLAIVRDVIVQREVVAKTLADDAGVTIVDDLYGDSLGAMTS